MPDTYITGHDGATLSGELVNFQFYTLHRLMGARLEELERMHIELKAAYDYLEQRHRELQRIIDEMEE